MNIAYMRYGNNLSSTDLLLRTCKLIKSSPDRGDFRKCDVLYY